ncbi:uncharacterized protein QC761_0024270 [Podospora bellae-mahoneyi]|uniref:NACHT domain-containing protein n=1 Tax=Podospora bellae-mahoneyi TaxID=2093777 RepID=A0ABR0G220_9PEZI|nr:hypothetical protein QC761_0024270 [Podospora bellae-mahoneyi]
MNKFDGPKCPDYKQVSGKILEFLTKICNGTPLAQADARIHNVHYSLERLKIERLSGDLLPMDRCYINLAIVEWLGDNATRGGKGDTAQQSSPFSLLARLKVETPDKTIEVTLPTLFEPRKSQDGQKKQPSRILIRGRAGVGKTTLCKKIVHDFKYNNLWQGLFNRVLWVPLRNLKVEKRQSAGYNFRDLFYHEYFSQDLEGRELSEALWRALKDPKSGRTLFILDGFDEVSQGLGGDMSVFLEELLNQPNVIITARPNARLPPRLDPLDLELETIGFYPDQITAYIENTFTDRETIKEVQSFLQRHPLMQGLMRIPIQLDAFCYTWTGFPREGVPETMTAVYKAIEESLWKKDILKLQKKKDDQIKKASRKKIESFVEQELRFLECLAFLGFYDDVIDLDWELRNAISDRFESDLLLDKDLPCLSFLRTSDPSSNDQDRNYHFLHLTFQEYFAARYFIRQWKDKQQLNCLQLSRDNCNNMEPTTFLEKYKYNPRYDIFWRFVAGLLDADDMALDFFQMIEKEPRDLLGPTHQRLIMHCLSEVERKESNFTGLRARLENQLEQWLLFESDSTGNSELVYEMECSGQVLSNVLTQASESERTVLLESLSRRTAVPFNVIEVVSPWLTNRTSARQCAAILRILGNEHNNLPDKVLQSIAARLEDEDGDVQRAAIEALGGRADLPDQVLQSIVVRLEDKDADIRWEAIEGLRGRADLPDQVLQSIVARLEDKDGGVQRAAIVGLRGRADLPDQVLQSIIARLEHEDGEVRRAAIEGLRGRADLPDQVFQSIAARLEDEDRGVRRAAIEALRGRADLPNKVLQSIAARLEDKDRGVRRAAIKALRGRADLPNKVLQSIAARLEDKDRGVRRAAIEGLRGRADLPNKVLQSIVARLEDKDRRVREAVIEALRGRADLTDQVLKSIAARLEDENWSIRWAAVEALRGRADLPNKVLQSIAARLEDKDRGVRRAAIKALRGRADLPNKVLQSIAARLEHENGDVQQAAIEALLYQSALSLDVLIPHIRSFYDALLQKSFREHLYWYASERSFIGTNLGYISLTSEQHNVKEVVRKLLLEKGAANVNDGRRRLPSTLSC